MSTKAKSHKAMADGQWMERLRTFASTGTWPSSAGNRPSPRQPKWHDLYQKIEKCPMQPGGQSGLFGELRTCDCGFHTEPATESSPPPSSSAASASAPEARPQTCSKPPNPTAPPSSVRTPSLSPSSSPSEETCSQSDASGEPTGLETPAGATAPIWLPGEWSRTLPPQDRRWISNALFQSGKLRPDLKLWYEPPAPALIHHQTQTPEHFFTHRLMVWMPYHLWRVKIACPACGKQLTGSGFHRRARKVLDIDCYYLMVTETLRCTECLQNHLSTSQTVRDQLDLAHRLMFTVILTRKLACDIRVITLLRDRTLGNSPARLVKQLRENHSERWLRRLAHYLAECARFVNQPTLFPVVCQEPPEPPEVPTSRWLLAVYGQDILSRIDHIKASITSTFGSILRLGSTQKVTKKLAGFGRGTALCVTSVSNEVGQILNSVLTVGEGPGLNRMALGLMERYRQAAVPPPVLLYVDSGCCGDEGVKFGEWPDLHIRLDIRHFMKRLAMGCTTNAHPLYATFMGSLSACIFEWDAGDLALLRQAKREQLRLEGVPSITDLLVDRRISQKELSLHCRRRTRGEEATVRLIEQLLQELGGAKGRNLLDLKQMEHIWQVQKRHVGCIQDLPDVPLYTETGTITKGGTVLKQYRCARGCSSLDSYYCHLNRFIPGTSANALNFQLYLLEGLNRWNQDRGEAAVACRPSPLLTYAGEVAHYVNTLSSVVLNRAYLPAFRPPARYTGELIGVDYLLSQTGEPLNMPPDAWETDNMLEEEVEEQEEEEGLEDQRWEVITPSLLDDPSFLTSQPASPQPGPSHQHHLPSITVGQPRPVKRKLPPADQPTQPPASTGPPHQWWLFPAPPPPQPPPPGPQTFLLAAPQALGVALSPAGVVAALALVPAPAAVCKRTRTVFHNTCQKCGHFQTAETGHSQYKGIVYCSSVERVPKEQWLEDIKKRHK